MRFIKLEEWKTLTPAEKERTGAALYRNQSGDLCYALPDEDDPKPYDVFGIALTSNTVLLTNIYCTCEPLPPRLRL